MKRWMERSVQARQHPPVSVDAAVQGLLDLWTAIPSSCFQYVVESLSRRLADFVPTKGGATRY